MQVRGLWEHFRIYHKRPRGLKDRLIRLERSVYEDLWALQDVSFELAPGDTFAVLGANGSGKSTLLKCLARILPPDRGTVAVAGSVASLLELGAGFRGDLTGRENIHINGSILGLKRRKIDEVLDRIIDFSGVREFIDTPVRNYSSGMVVRLGFAIAVHADPDIFLIDEILAVGDAAFQTKCFEAMHEFKRRGKTMILVTHDLDAATRLCDRAMLLDHGEVLADGPTRRTVETYRRLVLEQRAGAPAAATESAELQHALPVGWGTGDAEIIEVDLLDETDRPTRKLRPGDPGSFRMVVKFHEDVPEPIFGLTLRSDDGTEIYITNTMWRGISTGKFLAGSVAEVRFRQRYHLLPGRYQYTCSVANEDATQWYHRWEDCIEFTVVSTTRDAGRAYLDANITISSLD